MLLPLRLTRPNVSLLPFPPRDGLGRRLQVVVPGRMPVGACPSRRSGPGCRRPAGRATDASVFSLPPPHRLDQHDGHTVGLAADPATARLVGDGVEIGEPLPEPPEPGAWKRPPSAAGFTEGTLSGRSPRLRPVPSLLLSRPLCRFHNTFFFFFLLVRCLLLCGDCGARILGSAPGFPAVGVAGAAPVSEGRVAVSDTVRTAAQAGPGLGRGG